MSEQDRGERTPYECIDALEDYARWMTDGEGGGPSIDMGDIDGSLFAESAAWLRTLLKRGGGLSSTPVAHTKAPTND